MSRLCKLSGRGYVYIQNNTTKQFEKVYCEVSLQYSNLSVKLFPKYILFGSGLSFNGKYYTFSAKLCSDVQYTIEEYINTMDLRIGDIELKKYSFEQHDARKTECLNNLYDKRTTEWLLGDQLSTDYNELLTIKQEELRKFEMNCLLSNMMNYEDLFAIVSCI